MNISHSHKIIWWAPEKTASKATAYVLSKYDFYYYDEWLKDDIKKLCEPYHSHKLIYPEEFNDYQLICSIRNPYDRILSFFNNFSGLKVVYTKDNKEYFKTRLENFIKELFFDEIIRRHRPKSENAPNLQNYLMKNLYDGKIPDKYIKMESLVEDLGNLDFIKDSEMWKNGFFTDFLAKNDYIKKRPYQFYDVYSKTAAKIVYEYFKKQFFVCNYDPFSFTKDELTDEEKKNFLHDTL